MLLFGTLLMAVMTANVIARCLLASGGLDWAEELPQQLFPWFIMAGVALAVQRGGHIAVEWLPGRLGRRSRQALLLGGLLVVLADGVLAQQALAVAGIVAVELSPVMRLPTSYGYWAIAGGCVLLAASSVSVALRVALLGPEAMPQPMPEEQPA
ncbi:TRAP transporter small permease [Dankookia rubra]|nr:TRAP transporter small permease [Dankookia rubra]